MNNDRTFSVRLTTWQKDAVRFSLLRQQVFVNEQKVPAEIENDAYDANCVHAIAEDTTGNVIGTGRLLLSAGRPARIGRMAVYSEWRNNGVGAALLRVLVDEAQRRGEKVIVSHAQVHAERFYAIRGFVRMGEEYEEAGIAHIDMQRELKLRDCAARLARRAMEPFEQII